MRALFAVVLTLGLAGPAMAVEPEETVPPTPTETTTVCAEGEVWDPETERCTAPKDAGLDDAALFEAARELAYAVRFKGAAAALDAMDDPTSSRVLTYRGFIAGKSGDWARAEAYYLAALDAEPGYHLARSYFGQGLLAAGDRAGARAQLSEIRARGGRNTWAEAALALSLAGGGTSY